MGSKSFMIASQCCSYTSLASNQLQYWAQLMQPYWDDSGTNLEVPIHRKIWEWAFIASSLETLGMLKPGKVGLGFGVGKEPLVPLFAAQGCRIFATDQSAESAHAEGWNESNQFGGELGALNDKSICNPEHFEKLVTFRTVDMKNIPRDLLGFDFTWSSCAFEHLGTIEDGLEFVMAQMKCLRPGGVAVHTTEFNVSSNSQTIESGPTVLFRKQDLERLARMLEAKGSLVNLDFTLGSTAEDKHVDRPPWSGPHLRLEYERNFEITSFGLVVMKYQSRMTRSLVTLFNRTRPGLTPPRRSGRVSPRPDSRSRDA